MERYEYSLTWGREICSSSSEADHAFGLHEAPAESGYRLLQDGRIEGRALLEVGGPSRLANNAACLPRGSLVATRSGC